MDIQTALIGVAAFIVSAGILLFISMFGMKEKSYEEALAEQRQHANSLLGVHNRAKPKEKKIKKVNKKAKEKSSAVAHVEPETTEESEDTESRTTAAVAQVAPQPKPHVEFKEPTVTDSPVVKVQAPSKKRGKKDKVRPILVHKVVENPVIASTTDVPSANNFEQSHPKDDFELLHSHLHTKEDTTSKVETAKEKPPKTKQNGSEQEKGNKIRQNSLDSKETKPKQTEPVKEKLTKEKQNGLNSEIQKPKKLPKQTVVNQQPAEKEATTVEAAAPVTIQTNGFVANPGKEKKKKKNENNALQQISGSKDGEVNLSLLLNAVRKAELSRSEVQILIDLLLNKQHEAPEVVDEWSEGKADPVQKLKKQLAEKEKALAEEQEALVGVQTKLREIRAEQIAEKNQLQQRTRGLEEALQAKHLELQAINSRVHSQNQKIQQMQAQLNEEAVAMRKLHEENGALQLQRQQMDHHISQAQEAEATIQDLQSRNNQLTMELHSLTEQNMVAKDHQQNLIVQLQHQVNHFKSELDEKDNINRQFEDLHRDLEHRLAIALRQENEVKVELTQIKNVCQQNVEEMRRLEHGKGQALDEIRNLQKHSEDFEQTIAQLKAELQDVQAEKSELQQLKANGLAQETQSYKEELLNLHNELSSVNSKLQYVDKKYAADLDASKTTVAQLQSELEEQKNKNNELRKKNWKVMDALKAAESAKEPPINVDEITLKVRLEEQELQKKFVQRLFPDIKLSDALSHKEWFANVEVAIGDHLANLEKSKTNQENQEVTKLQAQIQHYKSIIEHTEGILKKLENHIEQEEIHWRKELKIKETEMAVLKEKHQNELQIKVEQLQEKLRSEIEEKQRITQSYENFKSRQSYFLGGGQTELAEKLSEEEVNRLVEHMFLKRKNKELVKQLPQQSSDEIIKEPSSTSTNGPSIEAASK